MTRPTTAQPNARTQAAEKLTPSEAFKRADALVREAAAYCPLLSADHLQALIDRLTQAAGECAAAQREGLTPLRPRPVSRPPPIPRQRDGADKRMVDCPYYSSQVRKDRLQRHIRLQHANGPGTTGSPSITKSSRWKREKIVCGDCDREFTRERYEVHFCRKPRPKEILIGAPGLGKRR